MPLNHSKLFQNRCYVDGAWSEASGRKTIEIHNPATGERLGSVPNMGRQETARAVEAANQALFGWRSKTAKERANVLKKWFALIQEHQEDLALLLTMEQGKSLKEARGEIQYGAAFIEWYAEEAKRVYGEMIPAPQKDRRILVLKQPIGVCAAITPWNFPNAMITRKTAPALAAGCTVVVKPAEQTPFSALALAQLAHEAGIPKGVFNVITGNPEVIGEELTSNPLVRKLSFTGSTEVGKLLMKQCSATVKKVSLELGGLAPFIVFEDADLDAALQGALASKYRNSGQTCICTNRFFVHESLAEAFGKRLADIAKDLKVGNGMDAEIEQGPLIDQDALQKVVRHIDDAVQQGAELLTGGKPHALGGTFFEPTVLTKVTDSMLINREETFGPVSAIIPFQNEGQVLKMANDTSYGLAAYVYTKDMVRIWRVAEALEYGMVGVNTGLISTEVAPFGGVKESGIGREGAKQGIDEYLEVKYLCLAGLA